MHLDHFLSLIGVAFEDLTAEDLTPILMYHVLGSKVMSGDLEPVMSIPFMLHIEEQGSSLFVKAEGGVMLNGSVSVTAADVETSNGVIHVIDGVLTPTSVVDIAINNSNFSKLVRP